MACPSRFANLGMIGPIRFGLMGQNKLLNEQHHGC